MNQITFDVRQFDNWDFVAQPPVPIPGTRAKKVMTATEQAAFKAAVSLGKTFGLSNLLTPLDEVVKMASPPAPTATILKGSKSLTSSSLIINVSTSKETTGSLAVATSLSAVVGFVGSMGFYASSTNEIGYFSCVGGGIFINSHSASLGGECTIIKGTPSDFAGPYFGLSVSAGTGVSGGATLLFAPTISVGKPIVLTFMGCAINVSATTPTKLPVTVGVVVTNTKISKITF